MERAVRSFTAPFFCLYGWISQVALSCAELRGSSMLTNVVTVICCIAKTGSISGILNLRRQICREINTANRALFVDKTGV